MGIIKFIKEWTLPCAMLSGACIYLLFTEVPALERIGDIAGPYFIDAMPALVFLTLYVTFCKIRLHDLHLHTWHAWMQAIRIVPVGPAGPRNNFNRRTQPAVCPGRGIRMCHLPDSLGSCRRDRKAGWEHRFHDCLHTHRQRCHSLARAFVVSADRKAGRHLFPRFVSHHPRTHGRRACLAILLRHGHPPVATHPGQTDKGYEKLGILSMGSQSVHRHGTHTAQHFHGRHIRLRPDVAPGRPAPGHAHPLRDGQKRGTPFRRQRQRRTSTRTKEHGRGYLAHRDLSQSGRRHRTMRLRHLAELPELLATMVHGKIRKAQVVSSRPDSEAFSYG